VDPRLKKLDIEDYERLTDLWETCGLPYRPKGRDSLIELERQLTLSQVAVWGLFDGEKLMASVFATHDGRKGWINRLAVQADYRRRGFAERLIRVAEDWLSSQGIGIFACIIEAGNDVSKAVFESADYKLFEGASYFTKRVHPDV
jgi:GNAT superfamily N-acetyltransferase